MSDILLLALSVTIMPKICQLVTVILGTVFTLLGQAVLFVGLRYNGIIK